VLEDTEENVRAVHRGLSATAEEVKELREREIAARLQGSENSVSL